MIDEASSRGWRIVLTRVGAAEDILAGSHTAFLTGGIDVAVYCGFACIS